MLIWNEIVREKIGDFLIELLKEGTEDKYAMQLAKQVDITYSHLSKVINNFKKEGLINVEMHGRTNIIKLTIKGKRVAEHLKEIKGELSKR